MMAGSEIVIEERSAKEVSHIGSTQLTPDAAKIIHPAFDVTPAALITALVTERGLATPPNTTTLASLKK